MILTRPAVNLLYIYITESGFDALAPPSKPSSLLTMLKANISAWESAQDHHGCTIIHHAVQNGNDLLVILNLLNCKTLVVGDQGTNKIISVKDKSQHMVGPTKFLETCMLQEGYTFHNSAI